MLCGYFSIPDTDTWPKACPSHAKRKTQEPNKAIHREPHILPRFDLCRRASVLYLAEPQLGIDEKVLCAGGTFGQPPKQITFTTQTKWDTLPMFFVSGSGISIEPLRVTLWFIVSCLFGQIRGHPKFPTKTGGTPQVHTRGLVARSKAMQGNPPKCPCPCGEPRAQLRLWLARASEAMKAFLPSGAEPHCSLGWQITAMSGWNEVRGVQPIPLKRMAKAALGHPFESMHMLHYPRVQPIPIKRMALGPNLDNENP